MKKILSCLLFLVVLSSMFTLTAFATEDRQKITISEDYKTVYYNGDTYELIDDVYGECGHSSVNDFSNKTDFNLTATQNKVIEYITANVSKAAIGIEITYKQSGYGYYTYLNVDCKDEYKDLLKGKSNKYSFSICNDYTEVEKDILFTKPIKIKGYETNYYEQFNVESHVSKGLLSISSGSILIDWKNKEYYYLDNLQFAEGNAYFDFSQFEEVTIYKITDKHTCEIIEDEYGTYYGEDDFDLPADEEINTYESLIVLSIIFILIPFVVLILSIIRFFRSSKSYKNCFAAIAISCILELIVLALLLIVVL